MVVAQDTRRSSHTTKKGKDFADREKGTFNESPGGEGSLVKSTTEYIKKLQAELAELKAAQGISSSSHTDRHRQRGQYVINRQFKLRYELRVTLLAPRNQFIVQ